MEPTYAISSPGHPLTLSAKMPTMDEWSHVEVQCWLDKVVERMFPDEPFDAEVLAEIYQQDQESFEAVIAEWTKFTGMEVPISA